MLTVKTQPCLSSSCVSIVILFLSLTNVTFIFEIHCDCWDCCLSLFFWSCHTSLYIPTLNLPSLFYQPVALLFFFSQALHGCLCSLSTFKESFHSTNFHSFILFIIHLFSFHINDSEPFPMLSVILWRNSLHMFMQYPLTFSSHFSLKHFHAKAFSLPKGFWGGVISVLCLRDVPGSIWPLPFKGWNYRINSLGLTFNAYF